MQRIAEQLIRRSDFNDASVMDDSNPVCEVADHTEIMRDEHISQVVFLLELVHQIQNLCTNRDIKCRNRFIGNDEFRIHDHGSGNADTLTLAAGEFMRIAGLVLRQKSDRTESFIHLAFPVFFILVQMEVIETFGNAVVDGCTLIQRSSRVLEDHLNIADHPLAVFLGQTGIDLLALEQDFSVTCLIETDDGTGDGRLAGTGFAYQGKRLAFVDPEVGILDGPEAMLAVIVERDFQVLDINQDFSAVLVIHRLHISRNMKLFMLIIGHRRSLPSMSVQACADEDSSPQPAVQPSELSDPEAMSWHNAYPKS